MVKMLPLYFYTIIKDLLKLLSISEVILWHSAGIVSRRSSKEFGFIAKYTLLGVPTENYGFRPRDIASLCLQIH